MRSAFYIGAVIIFVSLIFQALSCTKPNARVYDQVTNFWQTPGQTAAGVAPAYSALRDYAPLGSMFTLNEVTTDEVIVPTRGGDWYDGGVWEKAWKHTWLPDLYFFNDGWAFVYSGITRVNSILQAIDEVQPPDTASIKAELKILRAFYYYCGLDLFGNIPIIENNNVALSEVTNRSRKEVFDYVEKEIKENLPAITEDVNQRTYGRVTKWFAYALLAKLYLNSGIYSGTPRWAECIGACDAVISSGRYALEPDFFDNFIIENEKSRENIFVIPFDRDAGLNYFWLQIGTLHYQSTATFGLEVAGYANGHCSTAEYYHLFDSSDVRRKMFLVGQQYIDQIKDSAHMQYDTAVNIPLNFNPEIKSFSIPLPEARVAGARCAKWEFNKHGPGLMSNDFAVIRLADVILMKAEAQFRNGDAPGALVSINYKTDGVSIRSRTGLPDFTETEMNLEGLLKERARELSWEGWRRNDLIRFGHFTDARVPEKSVSADYRNLYPIPQTELLKNPYLKQNPGY
jgi:starch-binding outer membrane protein, SusD/RagB family